MPFDFNSLFNNPTFMGGMSLMGEAGQPGAMTGAMQTMQAMRQLQQEKLNQDSMIDYRKQQALMDKEKTRLYGVQTDTAKLNAQIEQQRVNNMTRMGYSALGMDANGSPLPQQAQQPASPMPMGPQSQGVPNAPQFSQPPASNLSANPPPGSGIPRQGEPPTGREDLPGDGFNDTQKAMMREHNNIYELQQSIAAPGQTTEQLTAKKNELAKVQQRLALLQALPTAQQATGITALTGNPYAAFQQQAKMGGAMRLLGGDMGGVSDIVNATKPNPITPGQIFATPQGLQQAPDPQKGFENTLALSEEQRKQAAEDRQRALFPGQQQQQVATLAHTGAETKQLGVKAEGEQQTIDQTALAKVSAYNQFDTIIGELKNNYNKLDASGGIVNPDKSAMENMVAARKSSQLGQLLGRNMGTADQSIRDQIQAAKPLLLQAIKQATGMSSKQLDSDKELTFYSSAATDPNRDVKANLAALSRLEELYGSKSPSGKSFMESDPVKKLNVQPSQAPQAPQDQESRYQAWKKSKGLQ